MRVKLGVNIDHVATVRQARGGSSPDPLEAARVVQQSGADGITVHLREDRRHIQDHDVLSIHRKINIPLNLEMAATSEMVAFACRHRPQEVCLVPEKRQELTTEGGLNVLAKQADLTRKIGALKKSGIRVSLFIDPSIRQIQAAYETQADSVELHTGRYADASGSQARTKEFKKLLEAGKKAVNLGLILNAGHGLDYQNVRRVVKIPRMHELNIGFSIVSRALFVGLKQAVKEMKTLLKT